MTNQSNQDLSHQPNIIWLEQSINNNFNDIGLKAYYLGKISKISEAIPPSFCISTSAYYRFFTSVGLHPEHLANLNLDQAIELSQTVQQYFFRSPLPVDVNTDLRIAYKRLATTSEFPVVLRPSVAYESPLVFSRLLRPFLNIINMHEFEKAVKLCWAYMWSEEIIRYRYQHQISLSINDLAILVQRQVPIEVSGSATTFYPKINADEHKNYITIEASFGLNEAVSRGLLVPDQYLWENKQIKSQIGQKTLKLELDPVTHALIEKQLEPEEQQQEALSIEQQASLVAILQNIFKTVTKPIEIEWCYSDNTFYILQFAPVTLSLRKTIQSLDKKKWVIHPIISRAFPEAMSPMGWSLLHSILEHSIKNLWDKLEFSPIKDMQIFKLSDNFVYINQQFIDLLEKQKDVYKTEFKQSPLSFLMNFVINSMKQKYTFWYPAFKKYVNEIKPLWEIEKHNRTKSYLLNRLDEILKALQTLLPAIIFIQLVEILTKDLLQEFLTTYNEEDINILFKAISKRQAATEQTLDQLMDLANKIPEVKHILLNEEPNQFIDKLENGQGLQFLKALKIELGKHGYLNSSIDPIYQTWVKEPTIILETLRDALKTDQKFWNPALFEQREDYKNDILKKMGKFKFPDSFIFRFFLATAQEYASIIQEQHYYITMYMPILRETLFMLNPYFGLSHSDDIFFVKKEEVFQQKGMNAGGTTLQEKAENRKRQWQIASSIGRDGQSAKEIQNVSGLSGSPGQVTGTIRVVTNRNDLQQLKKGEIIITDYFEPGWEHFLTLASGLIMELGGSLSHGSIVARRYGIPAVAGLKHATSQLNTGQIVFLNGTTGNVTIYLTD